MSANLRKRLIERRFVHFSMLLPYIERNASDEALARVLEHLAALG